MPDSGRSQSRHSALPPFDPDELVRWAETYGHPEKWAKKAQDLNTKYERLLEERSRLRIGMRFGDWVVTAINYTDGSVTAGREAPAHG